MGKDAARFPERFTTDLLVHELERLKTLYGHLNPRSWAARHNLAAALAARTAKLPTAADRAPLYQEAITLYRELIRLYPAEHQRTPSRLLPDTRLDLARI